MKLHVSPFPLFQCVGSWDGINHCLTICILYFSWHSPCVWLWRLSALLASRQRRVRKMVLVRPRRIREPTEAATSSSAVKSSQRILSKSKQKSVIWLESRKMLKTILFLSLKISERRSTEKRKKSIRLNNLWETSLRQSIRLNISHQNSAFHFFLCRDFFVRQLPDLSIEANRAANGIGSGIG